MHNVSVLLPVKCNIHVDRGSFKYDTVKMSRIQSVFRQYYCDDDCDEYLGWIYESEDKEGCIREMANVILNMC